MYTTPRDQNRSTVDRMPSPFPPHEARSSDGDAVVVLDFRGDVFHWRGPAPYHFVALPEEDATVVADVAREVTYGWGVIPVRAVIGATEWATSLFPKDGGYLLPLKVAVRRAESVALGDTIEVRLAVVRP